MKQLNIIELTRRLEESKRSHFTGRLDISTTTGTVWSLVFRLGRLVWATGGEHRFRRWQRLLQQFDLDTPPDMPVQAKAEPVFWEYSALMILVKHEWVTRETAIALIEANITEVLFDVLQRAETENLSMQLHRMQHSVGESFALLNAKDMLRKAYHLWSRWLEAGLAPHSPNMAPIIKRPEILQQRVSANTYQALVRLLNGISTLREIAVGMKQDVLVLTRSLMGHINTGLIGLQDVGDAPMPQPITRATTLTATVQPPLIVCIDDSAQVCRTLEGILNQAQYRTISIQDPLQALPILLEQKPHLIILDLVMPIASGYEICAQIRRVSSLKDIPVIILTGSDGIVDRVRAKIVGASDFLSKPVEPNRLLEVVRRHLANAPPPSTPVNNGSLYSAPRGQSNSSTQRPTNTYVAYPHQ